MLPPCRPTAKCRGARRMGCAASSSVGPAPPPTHPTPPDMRGRPAVPAKTRRPSDNSCATGSSSSWVSQAYSTRGRPHDTHESRSNSSRGSSPGRSRTLSESGLLDGGPLSVDKEKLVAHLLGNFNSQNNTAAQLTGATPQDIDRRHSDTELSLLPLAVLSRRRATWS